MARYFLHICNGHGFAEDHDGHDFPDDEAAKEAAIRGARDIMSADVKRGELDLSSFVEVEDDSGQLLFTVSFAEALAIKSEHHAPIPSRKSERAKRSDAQA